ncbi:MAG TPA: hypothetical protein P5571_07465 [Candidatus Krumholzibacteria bacterium]|nr:hypothetical protein [Candidatus Krumholzibacteria bacterium]HRX51180.1 hypothetical protein [Candidatus Krumholzibacteria bacterium]
MTDPALSAPLRLEGRVAAQARVSASMLRLDLHLEAPAPASPGQFCMLNLAGESAMTLSRPLSILEADGDRLSLLYKVVGRGTRLLADLPPQAQVRVLTPLGTAFPAPQDDRPRLLLAGGVGLPPLHWWHRVHGRAQDVPCFGARDGADAPWPLLPSPWRVSVDALRDVPAGRTAVQGNVVELARGLTAQSGADHVVLACGPVPLLAAAARFAAERGWPCHVSLEERMGCGYGVCRGCVAPTPHDGPWRLVCKDGPVLPADAVDWDRFGLAPAAAAQAYDAPTRLLPEEDPA